MQNNICGIIFKVSHPETGDTSGIHILGRSMLDWVILALGDSYNGSVVYSENVALPILVRPFVRSDSEFTVVLYSDAPLISRKTVLDAVCSLEQSGANVLRMTRGYVFRTQFLLSVDKIYTDNLQYFDEEDFITAYSFKQIALVSETMRNRILSYHMSKGVHFEDQNSTFVGGDVVIGKNVVVAPNCILKGRTVIRDNARIGWSTSIDSSVIDEGAEVESSHITSSYVGKRTKVGPYANLREGAIVGDECRIGDFVEIKASRIGKGTKVAHMAYIGDAEIGENCNIGCGVVFCNYDGKKKYHSKVGNRVFVGSNSNLVAPIVLEDDVFVAAGSTLTDGVHGGSLAIARSRQVNKPDWQYNRLKK